MSTCAGPSAPRRRCSSAATSERRGLSSTSPAAAMARAGVHRQLRWPRWRCRLCRRRRAPPGRSTPHLSRDRAAGGHPPASMESLCSTPASMWRCGGAVGGEHGGRLAPPMRELGDGAEADRIVGSLLEAVERDGFREYYNPLTGRGPAARGFGWSTLLVDPARRSDRGGCRSGHAGRAGPSCSTRGDAALAMLAQGVGSGAAPDGIAAHVATVVFRSEACASALHAVAAACRRGCHAATSAATSWDAPLIDARVRRMLRRGDATCVPSARACSWPNRRSWGGGWPARAARSSFLAAHRTGGVGAAAAVVAGAVRFRHLSAAARLRRARAAGATRPRSEAARSGHAAGRGARLGVLAASASRPAPPRQPRSSSRCRWPARAVAPRRRPAPARALAGGYGRGGEAPRLRTPTTAAAAAAGGGVARAAARRPEASLRLFVAMTTRKSSKRTPLASFVAGFCRP